jgi:hypothetical protein
MTENTANLRTMNAIEERPDGLWALRIRLPINSNGNPPLTWEGANGTCEEKHGDQCQCVKCVAPNDNNDASAASR